MVLYDYYACSCDAYIVSGLVNSQLNESNRFFFIIVILMGKKKYKKRENSYAGYLYELKKPSSSEKAHLESIASS